jgi:hypothetical protein
MTTVPTRRTVTVDETVNGGCPAVVGTAGVINGTGLSPPDSSSTLCNMFVFFRRARLLFYGCHQLHIDMRQLHHPPSSQLLYAQINSLNHFWSPMRRQKRKV